MDHGGNIIIGDLSALHFYLHSDVCSHDAIKRTLHNPLTNCANIAKVHRSFNCDNPLYGSKPITLLVPRRELRRHSSVITCSVCSYDLPGDSFFELRPGLYLTSPELTFLRLSERLNENRLAEIGIQLCARYFTHLDSGQIVNRTKPLTTPDSLSRFAQQCKGMRGTLKAQRALRFVLANSASPMEGAMKLQFCHPFSHGGFNLPFTVFNYEIILPRTNRFTSQSTYCIDLVNPQLKVGMEYDGKEFHQNAGKDVKRRNELKALGWEVFPLDSSVLYSPDETIRLARQIAKYLGIRQRFPRSWEAKFVQLRHDLDLPV